VVPRKNSNLILAVTPTLTLPPQGGGHGDAEFRIKEFWARKIRNIVEIYPIFLIR
jgi:hypothetical protein